MSNSVLSGLRQFAVIDPATDTAVVLTRLTSDSTYEPANIQTESTDGAVYGGRDYNLDVGFYDADSTKLAQLKTWMETDTPVQCVALGMKAVLHWFELTTISTTSTLNPNARDGASPSRIVLTSQNPLSDIKQGINFLKAAIWRDSSGSYTPPRSTGDNGDVSATGYGANFILDVDAPPAIIDFLFPFEGAVVSAGIDANADITVTVFALNAAGSTLASQALSGTGREVGSLTLPANTYTIAFQFAGTPTTVANITARIDGITTYTPN